MEKKIYSALEIAKYILYKANEAGELITNLKLQKLLYYAQAYYMVANEGEPLFSDDIEAWKYGPVIRNVYNEYKELESNPICLSIKKEDVEFLDKDQKEFLDEFLEDFLEYPASFLMRMTHQEDPWIDAYNPQCRGCDAIISKESIYNFYYKMQKIKEEQEDKDDMKIIEERKNDRLIPAEEVWKMLNVGN